MTTKKPTQPIVLSYYRRAAGETPSEVTMTTKRPTFEQLMADIKAGKVKDVTVLAPYQYYKLSKGDYESVAVERQVK